MLVLGPKEFSKAINYCKSLIRITKKLINKYIIPFDNEINIIKNHIIDLDGKIQPTYDLEDIVKKKPNAKKVRKISQKKL